MLPESLVTDVIAHALRGGASFAKLYVERGKRRALRVLDSAVKEATSGLEYGAGVRLFYGTEVAYAYTNDLTPAALLEVTDTLVRVKGASGRVDTRGRRQLGRHVGGRPPGPDAPLRERDRPGQRHRADRHGVGRLERGPRAVRPVPSA